MNDDLRAFIAAVETRVTDADALAPRSPGEHFIALAVAAFRGWRELRSQRTAPVHELVDLRRRLRAAERELADLRAPIVSPSLSPTRGTCRTSPTTGTP